MRPRWAWVLTLGVVAPGVAAASDCPPPQVYLVRHAEKAEIPGDPDVPLSETGRRSAEALAAWFEGRPLDVIYTTHLRRTQQTAAPLAAARDLELRVLPASATDRLLARLQRGHCGGHVLAVGHSNTLPDIGAALGAAGFSVGEGDYGWVYRLDPGATAVVPERYAE